MRKTQAISSILTGYDSLSSDSKSDSALKTGIERFVAWFKEYYYA